MQVCQRETLEIITRRTVALREVATAKTMQSTGRQGTPILFFSACRRINRRSVGDMQHRQPAKVSQTGAAKMNKGPFPAPPHDDTSHTWHNQDSMPNDYINCSGQAVPDDMGG